MRIVVSSSPGEVRVAAWDDDGLNDYAIWRPGAPDGVGDLYRGRITARVPAMAGAFVSLGGQDGFLPDTEGAVGEGTILGVRITRAAQGGKGPRLTARLSEAERALVASGPPALLRRGPNAIERLAALHPGARVEVDDPALHAALRPTLGNRLIKGEGFDDAIESAVAAVGEPVCSLPGGARLSVHPTPALTAIDIDLGAMTASRGRKGASQAEANRALLPALARQVRLRNLSGAILVDFGGLPARRRAALGPPLAGVLAEDPLRPRLLGFTALGLAEILRPRVHPPLHEILAGPHAAGLVALRRLAAEAAANPGESFILHAAQAVAEALQADTAASADLARRTGRSLVLRHDRDLPPLGWRIEESHAS